MPFGWRIVFTVLTLLTILACAGIGIVGIVLHWPVMADVVCFLLAGLFGVFTYHDFAGFWIPYFEGKVNSDGSAKA